jgi:hypothetical protein
MLHRWLLCEDEIFVLIEDTEREEVPHLLRKYTLPPILPDISDI